MLKVGKTCRIFSSKRIELNLESHDEVTKETLEDAFSKKTQAEWIEIFKDSDACVSPVLELHEAPKHPHNKQRNSFVQLDINKFLPDMNWLALNKSNRSFKRPKAGQHTELILKDLGYSQTEIDELIKDEVVAKSTVSSKL